MLGDFGRHLDPFRFVRDLIQRAKVSWAEALVGNHLLDFLRLLEKGAHSADDGFVDTDAHGDLVLPELESVAQVCELRELAAVRQLAATGRAALARGP